MYVPLFAETHTNGLFPLIVFLFMLVCLLFMTVGLFLMVSFRQACKILSAAGAGGSEGHELH